MLRTSPALSGRFIGWVPEAYLDEVCPPPRPTPDAWLRLGEVVCLDACDPDNGGAAFPVIAEGDTIVFFSRTDYPGVRVVLEQEEAWFGGLLPVVDGLSLCLRGDPGSLSDTPEEILTYARGVGYAPGLYEVDIYRWCEGQTFVLRGGVLVAAEVARG